ncbi:hypothetical protein HanPSC8_Chr16g0739811 [Helianthus annuus]|nr:hypothetical protein HanPSC8_Chr16g0739811 [Helianthus annuus]
MVNETELEEGEARFDDNGAGFDPDTALSYIVRSIEEGFEGSWHSATVKRGYTVLQWLQITDLQMFFLLSNLHGFTMAADKSGGDLL